MRANDRIILIVLPLVVLCLAFWFLLIAPKRHEASDLQGQIDSTNASIQAAQQEVAAADAARKQFPKTYGRLVELGRAVPQDNDQSTLVYDMSKVGQENDLDFLSFEVQPGASSTTAAPPPPAPTTGDSSAQADAAQVTPPDSTTSSGSSSATPTSAPTSAAAAQRPRRPPRRCRSAPPSARPGCRCCRTSSSTRATSSRSLTSSATSTRP